MAEMIGICPECGDFYYADELLSYDSMVQAGSPIPLGVCPVCSAKVFAITDHDLYELHDGGDECPVCKGNLESVDGSEFWEADYASITMQCMTCGIRFHDIYKRSGLEIASLPNGQLRYNEEEHNVGQGLCCPPDKREDD